MYLMKLDSRQVTNFYSNERIRLPYHHICSEIGTFLKLTPYFCINGLLQFLVTTSIYKSIHRTQKSKFSMAVKTAGKAEYISR